MILYNLVLESGLTYTTFANAFWGMWCEVIAAFITQRYIASPAVKKLVFRLLKPGEDKPIFITIAMAGATVSLMAPIITLFVTIFS